MHCLTLAYIKLHLPFVSPLNLPAEILLHSQCIDRIPNLPEQFRIISKLKHITYSIIFQIINIHRVSKNVPPLACCYFHAHEFILIFLADR